MLPLFFEAMEEAVLWYWCLKLDGHQKKVGNPCSIVKVFGPFVYFQTEMWAGKIERKRNLNWLQASAVYYFVFQYTFYCLSTLIHSAVYIALPIYCLNKNDSTVVLGLLSWRVPTVCTKLFASWYIKLLFSMVGKKSGIWEASCQEFWYFKRKYSWRENWLVL